MRSLRLAFLPLALALASGCAVAGAVDSEGEGPGAAPLSGPRQLFGFHDPGGEDLMRQKSRAGWVVYSEDVHDPNPHAYSLANEGFGVIVRLNWGYNPVGTLPCDADVGAFVADAAAFVGRSSGAHVFIVGNEANISSEWPTCNGQLQPITPDRYARVFSRTRDAIHALPGHAGDQVVMQGVGVWNVEIGMNWIQYYQAILNELGQGHVDGIALHTYTHGADVALVDTDVVHPDDHRQWGFRAYRDFLGATPRWARSLPVYITETDQNGPWSNADGGWVKAAYREISDWNGGAGSDERQKIQALALYRWHGDQDAIDDKPLVQQDLLEAMDVDAPSPAPAMPADPRVNACSTEDVGQAPWTPPQTNFTLSGYILDFWTHNGGLPVFGYPIERAHRMVNSSNAYVCSQMFERHRIELVLNPDGSVVMHGARPFVTLGLVGNEVYPRDADMVAEHPLGYGASGNGAGDCETFSQVGFSICGEFKAYWHAHGLVDGGSLQLFGYPKSQPFAYASGNGHTYVAQYFERARLELHPEDPNQRIKGGLLGDELNEGRRF